MSLRAGQVSVMTPQRAPPRVSLPPTTIGDPSEIGALPGGAVPLTAYQADMGPLGQSWPEGRADEVQQDDDGEGFTDTSSDFSYGSSDGSGGAEDAGERLVLRQARKALQVARKAVRKDACKVRCAPRVHVWIVALSQE